MAGSATTPLNTDALEKISKMDGDKFMSIATSIADSIDVNGATMRSRSLVKRVDDHVKDLEYSVALCSQLVALATVRRIEDQPMDIVFDRIARSMTLNGLSEEVAHWYGANRSSFLTLLDRRSVRLVAKALHLSTDFTELYVSSNLVTDIRPVFDLGRDTVVGGIVTQNLRLHYITGDGADGEHELNLSIDSDDIEKLITELQKAQKKSTAAKEFATKQLGENIMISGEDTYGFG